MLFGWRHLSRGLMVNLKEYLTKRKIAKLFLLGIHLGELQYIENSVD